MKNKVLLIAAILMLGASANSFAGYSSTTWSTAETTGTWSLGSTLPLTGIKPSANVILGYLAATSGTPAVGISYTVGTYHASGSFSYGTSSGDTNLYRMPQKADASFEFIPAAPTTAGAGATWTGWTAAK